MISAFSPLSEAFSALDSSFFRLRSIVSRLSCATMSHIHFFIAMRILNARLGHANNSSSSHSMIVVSRDEAARISEDDTGDYGWSNFTLTEASSKLDYLATAIWQQLFSQSGSEITSLVIVRELLNLPEGWSPVNMIDHQSTFELPAGADGSLVDAGFARAFAEWIQSPEVIILGGNDNSDGHPLAREQDALPFGRESRNPHVARFDERSGSWTLFNPDTGAKLRMSFAPGEAPELETLVKGKAPIALNAYGQPEEPPALARPELVDVKITDFCDIGCAWCYQGSTPQGSHADLDHLRDIARRLAKAGALEVAIGGGEPTRHPHFAEILETFKAHGINANFTTRDLSFLKDEALRARILSAATSIAVSVSSLEQLQAAESAWANRPGANSYERSPLSFQYVIGTGSDQTLRQMIAHSVKNRSRLTLLGYKDSGRGQQWRDGEGSVFWAREAKVQTQSTGWPQMVCDALGSQTWAQVSIDTALARECEQELEAANIPRHMWHKSEGSVSMYIDAVAMTMSPSSYSSPDLAEPFDAQWVSRFQAFSEPGFPSARSKKGAPRA